MSAAPRRDPILVTFFLCDQILRDQIAQKWGALGLYSVLYAPEFPITFEQLCFFARIAEAPAVIDFDVAVVSPLGVVLASQKTRFDRAERGEGGPLLDTWEVGGRVRTPTFSAAGVYRVVCSVNGVELGELSLHVLLQPVQR